MKVTEEQKRELEALYIHCAHVNFSEEKPDFGFYAERLDALNVPWILQNRIAYAAESRDNVFGRYFRNVLADIVDTI